MDELDDLTDAEIMRRLAAVADAQWEEIRSLNAAMASASDDGTPDARQENAALRLTEVLYDSNLVVMFPYLEWLEDSGYGFEHGEGLDFAPVTDLVRYAITWVRIDRHNEDSHFDSFRTSPMPDVVDGLLGWHDRGTAGPHAHQGVLSETNVDLVRQIFHACRDLTESTARPFSPDGHLVGSIGEVLAAQMLGLTLERPSTQGYDATDPARDHQRVEIKATTRNTVSLSAFPPEAERLVVLRLDADGAASIVYDGPYQPVWDAAGKPQKNGQRKISLGRLNEL